MLKGFFGDLACYNMSSELQITTLCIPIYVHCSFKQHHTHHWGHSGHCHFGFSNHCSGHCVAGPQTQKVYGVMAKGKHVSC